MTWKIPNINQINKEDFRPLLKKENQKTLPDRKPLHTFLKRTIDIIISLLALIILSPIFLLLIILVRISTKEKAIFAHERVGKNGKQFTIYKFRTMKNGINGQELSPTSPNDNRITKVGKFMRRTSLDELPQLVNILKGQMSLVGPRPEMPFIVKNYTDLERLRLIIKPGLTGIWQIKGRKDLPLHKNVEYDLYYIKNQSLPLDLIILLKTITVVFSGKGAY